MPKDASKSRFVRGPGRLADAISLLAQKQAHVLRMWLLDNKSLAEIADITCCHKRLILTRLRAGLKRLSHLLG